MLEAVVTILLGAAGSLLAVIVIWQFDLGRRFISSLFGRRFKVAKILSDGGITRMTLHRDDYHKYRVGGGNLRDYLSTAKTSIEIVSISLHATQAEGLLFALFAEKINASHNFAVRVTLLNPNSPVVPLLAKSMAITSEQLKKEIDTNLEMLLETKDNLPEHAKRRLSVYTHDTLPIGSAILLDANSDGGKIQVETKLYGAPRNESFGFEVVGPSEFYNRNYDAWQKVFRDSDEQT